MANAYTSGRLTLPTADVVYNLYTLMSALDTKCPIRGAELTISASVGNVQTVYLGGSTISTNNYQTELMVRGTFSGAASSVQHRSDRNLYTLKDIYMVCNTASQNVNVGIWTI